MPTTKTDKPEAPNIEPDGVIRCKGCGESDYIAIMRAEIAVTAHEYKAAGVRYRHVEGSETPSLGWDAILALRCRTPDCENAAPGLKAVKVSAWEIKAPAAWSEDAAAWRAARVKEQEAAEAEAAKLAEGAQAPA